ncbi:MAG: hypothetical protein R6X25_07055 [Candidatus Krumholzibacteriia bacterium]
MTPPASRYPENPPDWTSDWEAARREQMRRFRELPLAEKIKAVEEMERLAQVLQDAVKKRS